MMLKSNMDERKSNDVDGIECAKEASVHCRRLWVCSDKSHDQLIKMLCSPSCVNRFQALLDFCHLENSTR